MLTVHTGGRHPDYLRQRVREYMLKNGTTPAEVARRAGITRDTLAAFMRGQLSAATLSVLIPKLKRLIADDTPD